VNRFLTHLAVKGNVAASTQNQALAAVLFLYESRDRLLCSLPPGQAAISRRVAGISQRTRRARDEHVLEQPLNRIEGVVRARRLKRLPVVLTRLLSTVGPP